MADGFTYRYILETAELIGVALPALKRDYDSLCKEQPKLYRDMNRNCWLRQTGQQVQRLPMNQGTQCKSVDTEIAAKFSHDQPHKIEIRRG